jgi:FMN reductase
MRYLVISCSLNPASRSRILAKIAFDHLRAKCAATEFIDLASLSLPMCDAGACYAHPDVQALTPKIETARGVIFATAIYNYDVNSAAKNLVELTGDAWNEKVLGFVCAAGGHGSYMSVMPFANSLMLDFRCLIVPRFVYAPRSGIDDATYGDKAVHARIERLAADLIRLTDAMFPPAVS